MKIGDCLAFEDNNGIFGKLISKFTGSNITHVAMMLYGNQFIEASLSGIRISTLDKIKNKTYYRCELEPSQRVKIYRDPKLLKMFIDAQLYKPYDFMQITKFIPYILCFGLYTPKEDNKLYVCSELVGAIYEFMRILKDVNTSIMTPADIFNLPIYKSKEKINAKSN